MRPQHIRAIGAQTIGAVLALFLTSASTLDAPAILRVKPGSPGGDGSTWATAYPDLAPALAAAATDLTISEIWVAAGTYHPGAAGQRTATFTLRDGLALYGGFAGNELDLASRQPSIYVSTLSGDIDENDTFGSPEWDGPGWGGYNGNSLHVISANGVGPTAVVDGFTIVGGSTVTGGIPVPFGNFGGGMFLLNSSPTIRNCVFRRNTAANADGAGIFVQDGSITVENCVFEQNRVFQGRGAGIFNGGTGTPTIRDCRFVENKSIGGASAASGSGIQCSIDTPAVIERCVFERNVAENFHVTGDPEGAFGAGIYNFADGTVIRDCEFTDNSAHAGGGIFTWGDQVSIVNCLFRGNFVAAYQIDPNASAGGGGGGVAAQALSAATTSLTNCTFVGNTAGEGGGAMTYGQQSFLTRNSILYGNTATGQQVSIRQAQIKGNLDIAYCCIEALFQPQQPGDPPPDPTQYPGSIESDPAFVDLTCFDLRLSPGSPCLDAGDNAEVPTGVTTDLAGNPRFADDPSVADTGSGTAPIVDLGAYEGSATATGVILFVRGDANRDGSLNLADAIAMLAYLFEGGNVPCVSAIDVNDNGSASIGDVVHLLVYLFQGGALPGAPFPACGVDPTPDSLPCDTCVPCL